VSAGGPSTGYPAGKVVTLERISGHRDADLTACPGAALFRRLPALRRRVQKLEGAINGLSLTSSAAAVPYGTGLTVSGVLTPAVGNEAIEIRELAAGKERVVASALTAPDGTWSAQLSPKRNAVLRAVYRGGSTPGVISNVSGVTVTPVLTLIAENPERGATLVSGTVAPKKRSIKVSVYRRGKQVGSRTLNAADGDFRGTVKLPAGADRLIASVPADAATAGARSNTVKLPTSQP
jgi:hypothetical protein